MITCYIVVGGSQEVLDLLTRQVPDEYAKTVEQTTGFTNATVDQILPEQVAEGVWVRSQNLFTSGS